MISLHISRTMEFHKIQTMRQIDRGEKKNQMKKQKKGKKKNDNEI